MPRAFMLERRVIVKQELNQPLWGMIVLIVALVAIAASCPGVVEIVKTVAGVVAGALAMYINPKGGNP